MMQTIFSLSGILSPAAAAALIGLPALLRKAPDPGLIARLVARVPEGAVLAIAMDALSFLVAAIWLLYLNIPSPRMAGTPALKPAGLWTDVKEGMAFIGRRRGLMWLLATFAVVNFCSAPFDVLRPMIVRDSLAADYTRLGLSYEGVLGAFDPGLSVSICGAIALAFTIGQFFNRKVTTVEDDSIDGAHPERAAVAL